MDIQQTGEHTIPPKGEAAAPSTEPHSTITPANSVRTTNASSYHAPPWEKAAVMVAVGLLVVNIYQAYSNGKAANAALIAADAASDEVKLIRQQLRAQDAVLYVGIDPIKTFSSISRLEWASGVRVDIANAGQTAASDVHLIGSVDLKQTVIAQTITRHLLDVDFVIPNIPATQPILNGLASSINNRDVRELRFALTQAEITMMSRARLSVVFDGSITYVKQIGGSYSENVCWAYWANVVTDRSGNTSNYGESMPCATYVPMIPHIPALRKEAEDRASQQPAAKK